LLEEMLIDPVLAAYVIMGAELDVFQQARLRFYWWTPVTVDSSGVSSGKTLVQFVYVNLRCMLIADHIAGVYFPNFQTAKDEFWPYFARFVETAPLFREQFKMDHNKIGEHKYPGAYVMDYKNKSKFIMPAPSFMVDSETQASRRFNTLVVDDWLRAEDMGEGISRQLVDRVTRACFNKNHPIWCNHQKFLGHAERPSHKGYVNRVRGYKRAITDGSQRHSIISFNFRDWSPKFAIKFREDNVIKDAQRTLSSDQFERQYLGLWSRDGTTYYPETVLHRSCRREVIPMFGRLYENEVDTLGFDVAQGTSLKADWTSAVVHRIVEVNKDLERECVLKKIPVPPVTYVKEGRKFNRSFPFAHRLKNADVNLIAGFIHLLHRVFAFGKIVLDPRGGGLFVYEQLKKPNQLIDGAPTQVVPLCTRFEPVQADKQPIVCLFQRGGELDQIVIPQFLTAEEGFVEAMHRRYRESWEASEHHWPLPIEDRSPTEVKQWSQEQVWAQRVLDMGIKELANVKQLTDKDGVSPLTSKRGFRMFEAKGKKDVAYASMMAFVGAELWINQAATGEEDEEESVFV
jgi:hypothetical protein